MGTIYHHPLVKLVAGLISSDKKLFFSTEKALCLKFGRVDFRSPILLFDFTDYYQEELGGSLKRKFLSFQRLISPSSLAEIKLITNRLENKFSRRNKRMVNQER